MLALTGRGRGLCACACAQLLVTNWMKDVTSASNPHADMLLEKFYRWLCSPSSALYDPLLHRMVHRMMCKAFLQLVAELRQLGAVSAFLRGRRHRRTSVRRFGRAQREQQRREEQVERQRDDRELHHDGAALGVVAGADHSAVPVIRLQSPLLGGEAHATASVTA